MQRVFKTALATLFLAFVIVACSDDGANQRIVDAKRGVVAIISTKSDPVKGEGSALGTGFFIAMNTIVTNNHVIDGATVIKVATEKMDEPYDAEVVYSDPVSDIAVVRVKDWKKFTDENDFKILPLADPEELRVTQEVYAVGHPWGLFWSVSRGILSAVDKKIDASPKFLIQVDAHVYEGNSGGPLLDDQARVIGVNSLMMAQNGGSYGFALPVSMLEKVLRDFDKYEGKVHWAMLGVKISGATVKDIIPDMPAVKAGVRVGDVIVEFTTSAGTYTPQQRELSVAMSLHDPEEPVELKVKRGDQILSLTIQPVWRLSSELQGATARP